MAKKYFSGLNKVLANLHLAQLKILGEAPKIAENAGRIIEKRAKENITGLHGHDRHIITGNLRRSIDTRVRKMGVSLIRVEIGTDVYYAAYVEARDKTGGFLHPALYESREDAMNYIRLHLSGGVR